MVSRAYNEVISEYFDLTDSNTLDVLLGINEADQNRAIENLTAKLYQIILNKVTDIDFSSIERSKGNITNIEGYDNLLESVNVLKGILVEYRQDLSPINTVQEAISNIQSRTDEWVKAFNLKMDLPIIIYNSIVLAIVSSISFLIATSIEFIKDAGSDTFTIKLDKVSYVKNKENLLFENLKKFNSSCKNGELDRSLDHIFKEGKKQLLGTSLAVTTIVSTVAIIGIVMSIVPLTRELIFFFYNTKQNISDYFTIQADLVQMNAEYVKNNEGIRTAAERKEIAKKQQKIADEFRKIGNSLAISLKTGEKSTEKDIKLAEKKYKVEDVEGEEKFDSYEASSLF